jgi:ABC-type lipoprotein release transport system permease subunit
MLQTLGLSFRNLVRQKRRNILLGIAIAFGTMMLVMVTAFSGGISKVLFEKVVRYTNGHVALGYIRGGNVMNQVFPDGDRIRAAIAKEVPDVVRVEEAIGVFGRAIGNGVADNVILVGVDLSLSLNEKELKEFEGNFKMIEGSFLALNDKSKGIPVVLAEQKAKYLKLKLGDALRVRFTGVASQASSAQLTVVGIFKPANVFMSAPIFLELQDVRMLAGYGPHDIAGLHINLKDPQHTAKAVADRVHAALKPGLAVIPGSIECRGVRADLRVLGFRSDSASLRILRGKLAIASGDTAKCFSYEGVIMTPSLARDLRAGLGDTLRLSWKGKYDSIGGITRFIVNGIADSASPLPRGVLFVNEREFYKAYYLPLPAALTPEQMQSMPDTANPLWPALAPEYMVMKRCATTQEVTMVMQEMGRARYKGIMIQVQSMYETASAILSVQVAINLITFIAGIILFGIILIGMINTLRMTIKERTREIGTIRAIGMQKTEVRRLFVFETGLLSLLSSIFGTGLAFLVMWGLSSITIDAGDNPMGMLLVDHHLFFAPTALMVLSINTLIVVIAGITAFFPARRASNLSAAVALRHIE